MRKGIDSTFLHYGVRTEDMALIEQACQDSEINTEWLEETAPVNTGSEGGGVKLIGASSGLSFYHLFSCTILCVRTQIA